MFYRKAAVIAVVLGLALGAYAYEIKVTRLNSWELAFSANPPRTIRVAEHKTSALYTYIVYEVTNGTTQDVDFFPTFQIDTETGKSFTAGIYPAIDKLLTKRFGKDVLDFGHIKGIIKPGETKKGLAVFREVDPAAHSLTVYVGGISGDVKTQADAEGKLEVLYRTYKLVYKRSGDEFHVTVAPVTLESADWIWKP